MILNFHESRTIPISDIIKNSCSILLSSQNSFACRCIIDGPSEILHNEKLVIGKVPHLLNYVFAPRKQTGSWATLTIIADESRQIDQEPYELLLEIQELPQQPQQLQQ